MLPLPKPISPLSLDPGSGPTYTQIFHDTMGVAGTADDGYDLKAAELAGISSAFGVELNSDPLGGSLGTAGTLLGLLDTAPLDGHLADYVGTKEYGMGIVAAASGAQEPQLLTLPLTPGDGSVAFIPPRQQTKDFGTVKLGSAPQAIELGRYEETQALGDVGDHPKSFVIGAPPFTEYFLYRDSADGSTIHVRFGVTMTPILVGQWTAQYEYVDGSNRQLVILTLAVSVIP
jgi:hypothetical protein